MRRTVTALVAALVALTWVEVGGGVFRQWREYRDAAVVLSTNGTVDKLLQAAQNLAFERGRTNVLLRASGPVAEDNRAFVAARRQAVADNLEPALFTLGDHAATVAEGYARIKALRVEVDAALARPREARDPALADRWFTAASALVADLGRLMAATTLKREQVTSSFRVRSRLKIQAFELRDALGVESSRLAAGVSSGKPLERATVEEIMRLRGQAAAVWSALQRDAGLAGSPAVDAALKWVDEAFFTRYRPLEDKVLAAARSGEPYPVPVADLTAASVPALDSIARLMAVVTTDTAAYAEGNMADAARWLLLHSLLAAITLALGGGTLVLAVRRLLRPLGVIQEQLDALAQGDTVPVPPATDRDDEMGRMARAVRSFRDSLVERERMAGELARLSRQNELILDCAGDGIIGLDGHGETIFFNPAARRMLGWHLEDFAGHTHHERVHHTRADGTPHPQVECPVHLTLADGHPRSCPEDVFWRKDGTRLEVAFTVDAIIEDGRVQGAVIVFRDIGDARRAAAEREALVNDLKRSNTDLEQFAYAVSHDLQEPLRSVAGHVQLLARRLGDRLEAGEADSVAFAVNGAKRMSSMINALLEFARVGTRAGDIRAQDASAALGQAMDNLAMAVTESGTRVAADELPWVMADESQLVGLFQNLIANAIKYRVPDRPAQVAIACRRTGPMVELSVTDNGPGIPAEERSRIFGVFQRVGARPDVNGLGMGLAICKRIVERHGGRIWVEDGPEGGCRFTFTLPAAAPPILAS
ncbi:MAG: ATP-binding protein [Actinomycetota bacterium]